MASQLPRVGGRWLKWPSCLEIAQWLLSKLGRATQPLGPQSSTAEPPLSTRELRSSKLRCSLPLVFLPFRISKCSTPKSYAD